VLRHTINDSVYSTLGAILPVIENLSHDAIALGEPFVMLDKSSQKLYTGILTCGHTNSIIRVTDLSSGI
jgi:hypothetical protein